MIRYSLFCKMQLIHFFSISGLQSKSCLFKTLTCSCFVMRKFVLQTNTGWPRWSSSCTAQLLSGLLSAGNHNRHTDLTSDTSHDHSTNPAMTQLKPALLGWLETFSLLATVIQHQLSMQAKFSHLTDIESDSHLTLWLIKSYIQYIFFCQKSVSGVNVFFIWNFDWFSARNYNWIYCFLWVFFIQKDENMHKT